MLKLKKKKRNSKFFGLLILLCIVGGIGGYFLSETLGLSGFDINLAGFSKNDNGEYTRSVDYSQTSLDFAKVVTIAYESSWKLASDSKGEHIIENKTATLSLGENTYYVIVTNFNGKTKGYTVCIVRRLWDGDGSEVDPYVIFDAEGLSLFESRVNSGDNYSGKYFALGSNIDLKGAEWTPIGISDEIYFSGSFDGCGYTIGSFVITKEHEYAGVFGYFEGSVKNLGIIDFNINTSHNYTIYAGGLVGRNSSGTITNCYATGDVSATSSSSSYSYAGGLVGVNGSGTITNCYATGDIGATNTSSSIYSYSYAGGLVGYNSGGTITICYAAGDIGATNTSSSIYSYSFAGGLAGYNSGGTITNCYATGDISAISNKSSIAGGLVGMNNDGTITNCYATGDVSADSCSSFSASYAGGLVGGNGKGGTITRCYAINNISTTNISPDSSASIAGDLAGFNNGGTITDCYSYDGQEFEINDNGSISYSPSNTWGTACTQAQLDSVDFYAVTLGWSSDVWEFVAMQMPTLK